jgi:hypothetical protein
LHGLQFKREVEGHREPHRTHQDHFARVSLPKVTKVSKLSEHDRVCRVSGLSRVSRVSGVSRVCRVSGLSRVSRVSSAVSSAVRSAATTLRKGLYLSLKKRSTARHSSFLGVGGVAVTISCPSYSGKRK